MPIISNGHYRMSSGTGSGRQRRERSAEFKRQVVSETFVSGVSVAEVAHRHGVNANLLFTWRRQLQAELDLTQVAVSANAMDDGPACAAQDMSCASTSVEFIPLGVLGRDDDTGGATLALPLARSCAPSRSAPLGASPKLDERAGIIEVDLPDGTRVRVDAFVNEKALRRVFLALKGIL